MNSEKTKEDWRILVAEDDEIARRTLCDMLKKSGYSISAATDGHSALSACKTTNPPQLIILDWMMPEMSGLEVCRRIREMHSNDPPYILLLTARDRKEDIIAGLNTGADDYVSKPYHPGELQARIAVGIRILDLRTKLNNRIHELNEAHRDIKTLRGILPICAHCHKIRNDKGYWQRVEAYIQDHSDARFSHGYCDECGEKILRELA